ncbi:MAG TPA: dTDP-4-dehydrorhamnose 3,5-epimerase [Candidatus Competibacteraceae bacterium]|nr:dTDP-4-dehydrorhamnose 3,5-epimerase [Candidatus Competibacteraceae bacterium]
MNIIETELPGVLLLEPRVFGDQRGFFLETYRHNLLREAGVPDFVQDNHSRSRRGVLRGLHYQLVQPQGKLVRVARGRVFDVAVDVRRGSPSFGRWVGVELDDLAHRQLYIPPGFAHGFVVLSEEADFIYKCTDYYHPQSERGVAWNDPDIGIAWPLTEVSLSDKDARNPRLHALAPTDLPAYEG